MRQSILAYFFRFGRVFCFFVCPRVESPRNSTSQSNKSCISRIFCSANLKAYGTGQNLVYSYRWGRAVKSVSFPFVHNRHSSCSHSLWRLFITTPLGCEHFARHLFTRRATVVNKWFGGSVLGECGEMMKMYKYTIAVYLCKTEALRMPYFGTEIYWRRNTRILEILLYNAH